MAKKKEKTEEKTQPVEKPMGASDRRKLIGEFEATQSAVHILQLKPQILKLLKEQGGDE